MKPERFKTKGGSCTKAFPGYNIHILNNEGEEIN